MSTVLEEQEELLKLLEYKENEYRYNKIKSMFPDSGPYRRELYGRHIKFITASANHSQLAFIGANRPLAEDTLVCMADGTKKELKDIEVGDTVLALNRDTFIAEPSKVLEVSGTTTEEVFEIECARHKTVEATRDHQFPVSYRSGTRRIKQIPLQEIDLSRKSSIKYGLITPSFIDYKSNENLPLDPYVLGCLLGDGSIKSRSITFTNKDVSVLDRFVEKGNLKLTRVDDITYIVQQGFSRDVKSGRYLKGPLRNILDSLGLFDKTHIPTQYLISSKEDRMELLAGLIDTDGTCNEFTQKNEQLVKDFCQLVISLGGYAHYYETEKECTNNGVWGTYYRAYYRLPIKLPLALEYKQPELTKRMCDYSRNPIVSVKSKGIKNVRCISIAHEDHLFLVNDFVATSNTGKTRTGAFIMATHLTGDYPEWWEGRKYLNAIDAWASGKTNQKTKEILQLELLGPDNDIGSGLLPKDSIVKITKKPGVADAVETVTVKHKSGGISTLTFKSYEQGRDGFEGTKKQVIWLDEEPADASIYSECLMRTADMHRPGIIYCTFTPLYGLSDVVMQFLPDGKATKDGKVPENPDRFSIQTTWDDVPHLSESDKKRLWDGCLPHEREARSKGIPSLGAGAIYPYLEDNITVEPFEIPFWWPRGYGMDTGWSRTAVVWGAMDPDTKVMYLYSEHYQSEAHPAIHASAIKARGTWLTGAADPAGANISDGKKIFDMYVAEGLDLVKADKADREGGILKVNQMFATGQLKIFKTLHNTLGEFRVYRRDEKGQIIKKKDHAMDAMRYLLTTGIDYLNVPTDPDAQKDFNSSSSRDEYTGY